VTVLTQIKDKLAGSARAQETQYAGDQDRPLGGYVLTMSVYAGLVGTLAGVAKATGREVPERISAPDIVLSAVATQKLSRLIARDSVTSPLRAPFTSYQGVAGPAELQENVRGQGVRKTIGELVTCPFCTSVWVATGFTAGLIYLPRTTRLAMGTLTALAGSDLLQYGQAWLQDATS
jgi:Protein of unknown function (DUF1360)